MSDRRYPKRQRAEVSYCEVVESDHEEEEQLAHKGDAEADGDEDTKEGATAVVKKAKEIKAEEPSPESKIFPFLQLPGEIRNKIYEAAFCYKDDVYLVRPAYDRHREVRQTHKVKSHRRYWRQAEKLPVRLLGVNRQIYQEGSVILYKHNVFDVEDTQTLFNFLVNIGTANIACLTNVRLEHGFLGKVRDTFSYPALSMLVPAMSLRQLTFSIDYWRGPALTAHVLVPDLRHFIAAYGRHRGDKHAAVQIMTVEDVNGTYNKKRTDELRTEMISLMNKSRY